MYTIYIAQRDFLLTIYKALLPKSAYGSAGWVSNDTLRLLPSMGSKDDLEIFERQINKILFLLFIYNLLQQSTYSLNNLPCSPNHPRVQKYYHPK